MMDKASPSHDPDETRDIRELIDEVIPNPEQWLETPNAHFGGKAPKELIWVRPDAPESGQLATSFRVRQLVRAIKNGVFW